MTKRVVIGRHNNGNYGLYVSMPGIDAYYGDTNSRSQYSFSSDWPNTLQFVMSGTAAVGTWVTIPSYITYWPMVYWEIQISANQYKFGGAIVGYSNSSTMLYYNTYKLEYQTSGSSRQFRVASYGAGGTFRYIVTNLVVS